MASSLESRLKAVWDKELQKLEEERKVKGGDTYKPAATGGVTCEPAVKLKKIKWPNIVWKYLVEKNRSGCTFEKWFRPAKESNLKQWNELYTLATETTLKAFFPTGEPFKVAQFLAAKIHNWRIKGDGVAHDDQLDILQVQEMLKDKSGMTEGDIKGEDFLYAGLNMSATMELFASMKPLQEYPVQEKQPEITGAII